MTRELIVDTLMLIFNVILLSVIYHIGGLETLLIFGFAKVMTEIWRGETKHGATKTLRS